MDFTPLHDVLLEQLGVLYSAERRLVFAVPDLADTAFDHLPPP